MTTTPKRPYAALSNVLAVFGRVRSRNLPEAINNDFLRIAGIPEVVFGRVSNALEFLGLVGEDGAPTETLKAMASAPEAEYKTLLAAALRNAYRDDLQNVDPAQDDQSTIIDAFRRYEPRSQTQRMVMLFLGLCREAGIPVKDAPRERKMQPAVRTTAARPTTPSRAVAKTTAMRTVRAPATPQPQSPDWMDVIGNVVQKITAPPPMFAVTDEDIGALSEDDFEQVWSALGKIARARAARQTTVVEVFEATYSDAEESDEDPGDE